MVCLVKLWRFGNKISADLVSSGVDGADLYQLNVFDGSDLSKDIANGGSCQLLRQQSYARGYVRIRSTLPR